VAIEQTKEGDSLLQGEGKRTPPPSEKGCEARVDKEKRFPLLVRKRREENARTGQLEKKKKNSEGREKDKASGRQKGKLKFGGGKKKKKKKGTCSAGNVRTGERGSGFLQGGEKGKPAHVKIEGRKEGGGKKKISTRGDNPALGKRKTFTNTGKEKKRGGLGTKRRIAKEKREGG